MAITRSASMKQASLEECGFEHPTESASSKHSDPLPAEKTASIDRHSTAEKKSKRKRSTNRKEQSVKESKSDHEASSPQGKIQHVRSTATDLEHQSIFINRSPVLQLWAAVVAGFLHPHETWATCLSIGGAISTLCAISKGRAIGKIEPKDRQAEGLDVESQKRQQIHVHTKTIDVMGFELDIEDGVVVISGKAKPVKEGLLQGKYGGEDEYFNVKRVMEDALRIWSDDKELLDKKAFSMYEKFRPGVAAGSSGWGRKGELSLDKVKSSIESKR